MPILTDFHLHSNFSGDCNTSMENMILQGIELGLQTMCFTEHLDLDFLVTDKTPAGMFEVNIDSYLYDLLTYKEKYKHKINLLFGIELGLQPHLVKKHIEIVTSYDFDFVIGSSHLCHKKDPFFPEYFQNRFQIDAYREYFESILENIESYMNFDVYGHFDYIIRYGLQQNSPNHYEDYKELIDSILKKLIKKEKGIEINTSGYSYGLNQPHPSFSIIKRYKELGGEIITIGSDAHTTEKIASNFNLVSSFLKDCGFQYYTVFEQRNPTFLKL